MTDTQSPRFYILPGNKTTIMDRETGEVYRTPAVSDAAHLLSLLQALSNTFQSETVPE